MMLWASCVMSGPPRRRKAVLMQLTAQEVDAALALLVVGVEIIQHVPDVGMLAPQHSTP